MNLHELVDKLERHKKEIREVSEGNLEYAHSRALGMADAVIELTIIDLANHLRIESETSGQYKDKEESLSHSTLIQQQG